MKPIALLAILALLLSIVAVTTTYVARPTAKADGVAVHAAPNDQELARTLAQIQAQQTQLASQLDDLAMQVATNAATANRSSGLDLDAAIERALAGRAADVAAPVAARAKPKASDYFARLDGVDWEDAQAVWKELAEAGLSEEVLSLFEQRAAERSADAQAQIDLGKAYLQMTFKAGGGPEAGVWATKADKQFDTALTLDDRNWEARFQKATALSFWPAVMGKQGQAIQHFETLVQQQQGQAQKPEFAMTYLFLGNMHQQMGKQDKALAAWNQGLALFPNHKQLLQQLQSSQGN